MTQLSLEVLFQSDSIFQFFFDRRGLCLKL
jgi:hypothetical protein